jgi:hypothetical protein
VERRSSEIPDRHQQDHKNLFPMSKSRPSRRQQDGDCEAPLDVRAGTHAISTLDNQRHRATLLPSPVSMKPLPDSSSRPSIQDRQGPGVAASQRPFIDLSSSSLKPCISWSLPRRRSAQKGSPSTASASGANWRTCASVTRSNCHLPLGDRRSVPQACTQRDSGSRRSPELARLRHAFRPLRGEHLPGRASRFGALQC